jgi:hypothetical protein
MGRWPTQARFWLEWGCSLVTDLVRRTKPDCPHAMGTHAFPPQRAESFRHFLLLPSPPVVHYRRKPTNLRVGLGARAAQVQASGLWLRRHAGACSPPARRPQKDTLADALKSLTQGVSRRLIGDAEHFWQKRYYDFNIRNYPQFVEKLRYIHRNPVKRGLCEHPEDWAWSSFRHYATGCEGRVEIESEWTARKRERAAGRLGPAVELPHSSQNRAWVGHLSNQTKYLLAL